MKKGQEEAPIELLLGVTLLTFVIILGFYTYQNLSGSLYEQKLKDSLSIFARSLELVYQGGEGTSKIVKVDFGGTSSSIPIESIRLLQGIRSACQKNLGKDECLQLMAITVDGSGPHPFMIEMLNIPPHVIINLENPDSTCDLKLNELIYDTWDDPNSANCGWKAKSYSFEIEKISATELNINQIGG
jgi:hypothetical protein